MNKGICNKISDNNCFNCPARMQDARQFTDYKQNIVLNAVSHNMTSEEYRKYLTHRAIEIMRINDLCNFEHSGCKGCAHLPPHQKHQYYLQDRQ